MHKKYKANEDMSRHKSKKKMKINNEQKIKKIPCANKTCDKKVIVYHKLTNDRGALAMMCGRYEEPQPRIVTH
jgi:hypothetical protein